MSTYQIQHQVGIKASAESIYQALTDPKLLAKWWTADTRGKSEVGSHLEFWFGNFCQKFEVTALKPRELVKWKGAEEGMRDWAGTEISFRMRADGDQTFVRFTHANWANDTDFLAHCSTKWAVFLISLKDLMETGKGRPAPDDLPINHS